MGDNQEAKKQEDTTNGLSVGGVKIGLSVKSALLVNKYILVAWALILFAVISLMFKCYSYEKVEDTQETAAQYAEYIKWNFVGNYFFAPLFIYSLINISAVLYNIFALTRNSVRYLYVDVFYMTMATRLLSIFYCTYMLVMIFTPHHFLISASMTVVSFDLTYLIFAGVVFSYVILEDIVVISYIAGLYFKLNKLVKILSKYWWIRLFLSVVMHLLCASYYIYNMVIDGHSPERLSLMAAMIIGALINGFYLYRVLFQPKTFKMKSLDEIPPPPNMKIQTAIKIMKMKEDVKSVAAASA